MTLRPITIRQAEFVAHRLAVELMNSETEPIPPFDTRSPGKLESCLGQPFQTFDSKYLYRTFVERAAILFYLIAKNHCFENGNKRMAVTLTMVFCYINKRWLNIDARSLYDVACEVAESDPKDMDTVYGVLVKLFKAKLTPHPRA